MIGKPNPDGSKVAQLALWLGLASRQARMRHAKLAEYIDGLYRAIAPAPGSEPTPSDARTIRDLLRGALLSVDDPMLQDALGQAATLADAMAAPSVECAKALEYARMIAKPGDERDHLHLILQHVETRP